MAVKKISQEEFETDVLKNDKVVLVDFFATWCMPCKMLSGVLEEVSTLAVEYADIVKVDIDENMPLAKEYGVMSVPTMVVMKNGIEVERMVGFRQPNQILETLNTHK